MLVEIKYCGSSTVTNNKQKHSQNVMSTIFSSGCYAPYIYTIIAAPLHFLRVPLSSIFCFIVALGPSTLSSIAESRSAVARDVDYPVLIPSREFLSDAPFLDLVSAQSTLRMREWVELNP